MSTKRISKTKEQEIVDTYTDWDFDTDGDIDIMVTKLGISRQSIYRVLKRNDIPLRNPRNTAAHGKTESLEQALRRRLDETERQRQAVAANLQGIEDQLEQITRALDAISDD